MNLLLEIVQQPARLHTYTEQQWDQLLRFARHAKMLSTLAVWVQDLGIHKTIPAAAWQILEADTVRTNYLQQQARYEVSQLEKVLCPCDYPVVLLKGCAYLAADLPPSRGRRLSDVDILVPAEHLAETESRLNRAGWRASEELNVYDERYYREWSHEIPPLRHQTRILEIDLHHNLVAPTSRIKLKTQPLFAELAALPNSNFYMLSPEDMYLHSATHLFFNDELRGGLRDLVDLYLLGEYFTEQANDSSQSDFAKRLIDRSLELGMDRPLYYALSTSQRLLGGTNLNLSQADLDRITPNLLNRSITSFLIDRIIAPHNVEHLHNPMAEALILIRTKWLSMPPWMLFKHLAYKSSIGKKDKG